MELTELHILFGGYDLVAKIEAEDYEKIGDIVLNKIRTIEGMINTIKLMVTKFRYVKILESQLQMDNILMIRGKLLIRKQN